MTDVFSRVLGCKRKAERTWEDIASEAGIRLGSWMSGVPYDQPTDDELRRLAPVLGTTYEYLRYGK